MESESTDSSRTLQESLISKILGKEAPRMTENEFSFQYFFKNCNCFFHEINQNESFCSILYTDFLRKSLAKFCFSSEGPRCIHLIKFQDSLVSSNIIACTPASFQMLMEETQYNAFLHIIAAAILLLHIHLTRYPSINNLELTQPNNHLRSMVNVAVPATVLAVQ